MNRYKKVKVPKKFLWIYNNQTYSNGFTRDEHRYIMEKHLKRRLNKNEVVEHKDGNKKNNKLRNLKIMTRSEHTKMHYLKGDYKTLHSKKAHEKLKPYYELRRLPHTKEEYTCDHCKRLKHKSQFWRDKKRWNGLRAICIKCESLQQKLRRKKRR
jgi:hypothetical protein